MAGGLVQGGISGGSVNGTAITPTTVTASTVTVSAGTGSKCFSADDPTLVVNCNTHTVSFSGSTMTVLSSGKVGIGTASPADALEVDGVLNINHGTSDYDIKFNHLGGGRVGQIEHNGSGGIIVEGGAGGDTAHLVLGIVSGVASFTGNVGLSTTTPSTRLSVYGVITSSTTQGTIACNAGTGTLAATCTDQHCTFTAGASAANCTYTFGTAWPKTPDCICADDSSILAIKATASTTSVICTAAVTMSNDSITFLCMGAP